MIYLYVYVMDHSVIQHIRQWQGLITFHWLHSGPSVVQVEPTLATCTTSVMLCTTKGVANGKFKTARQSFSCASLRTFQILNCETWAFRVFWIWAQNVLGHKIWTQEFQFSFGNQKGYFRSTSELGDSFFSLVKRQAFCKKRSRWSEMAWLKKIETAQNLRLWEAKNCSKTWDCGSLTIQLKFCEIWMVGNLEHSPPLVIKYFERTGVIK